MIDHVRTCQCIYVCITAVNEAVTDKVETRDFTPTLARVYESPFARHAALQATGYLPRFSFFEKEKERRYRSPS